MKIIHKSRSLTEAASTVEILRRYSMFNFSVFSFKLSYFQIENFQFIYVDFYFFEMK